MPRTPYRKKRTYRKKGARTYRKKALPRPLSTGTQIRIRRSVVQNVNLNPAALSTGWSQSSNKNIYRSWEFALSDLPDYDNMCQMFKYYKITAVHTQIFFSNTGSEIESGARFQNSQLLFWTDINQNGAPMTGSDNEFVISQTAKKKLCLSSLGRPLSIFHKTKQTALVYNTAVNFDFALQSPKFIATNEPSTPHYGLKTLLQRVDHQDFADGMENSQRMKIINTYYITLKKIH